MGDGCWSKVFAVGYEVEATGQTYWSEIREGTIKNVAEIGARIVITLYPFTAVIGRKSNRIAERCIAEVEPQQARDALKDVRV